MVELGAVLSQLHDGVDKPVAFASRSLTPAEQKYSLGESKALDAFGHASTGISPSTGEPSQCEPTIKLSQDF